MNNNNFDGRIVLREDAGDGLRQKLTGIASCDDDADKGNVDGRLRADSVVDSALVSSRTIAPLISSRFVPSTSSDAGSAALRRFMKA